MRSRWERDITLQFFHSAELVKFCAVQPPISPHSSLPVTISAHHLRSPPLSPPAPVLQCVALKPTWGKGYSRLGAAYFGLEDYAEAVSAYEQGLQHDPASEQLQGALADAKAAAARPPPGSSPFSKPEFLAKMAMDPRGRALMGQPDFQLMLRDVQSNPSSMGKYLQDPRFQIVSATKG